MSDQLQTPVSIFFYRRPDHLRQVMAKIRQARPMVLFGISDGPKTGNEEIRRGVDESRKVFREAIDWPCRWELLEREENLGSYLSVSRGLDWVFERVGETIVLEDDTVPDPTFFRFVSELLEKYRNDPKVGAVCGNNYDDPKDWPGEASYRFTRYHHSWGWGTWKRAWKRFDREEKLLAGLPELKKRNWMQLSRAEWAYWERCFHHTYAKKLDAWDYRWTLSLWTAGLFCIIPRTNLVRNIGFDNHATHTQEKDFANLKMHDVKAMNFPLLPRPCTVIDFALDDIIFKNHYRKLEGRRGMLAKIRDKILKAFFPRENRSSISDSRDYRNVCREAALDARIFATFKRDYRYCGILEHTTYEEGLLYLEEIKKTPAIFQKMHLFTANDKMGNPKCFEYPGIGRFSPTSLRYVKVLADLHQRFGNMDGLRITEIGGGYGGQCLIIHLFSSPQSYKIFDLVEPLLLTKKYLQKNGVTKIEAVNLIEFLGQHKVKKPAYSDLMISNYAFSEIEEKIQQKYLTEVIIKSLRGYMTMNSISAACGVKSLSLSQIVGVLETKGPVKVEPENPCTFQGNQVIWWDWSRAASSGRGI